jgi:leucine-rich repeat protein SHOC2
MKNRNCLKLMVSIIFNLTVLRGADLNAMDVEPAEDRQIIVGFYEKLRELNPGLEVCTPDITSLTKLIKLDFCYNRQLVSLPSEIGSLTALEVLHLSNTRLTFLPPEIGSLTALVVLNLYGTRLTSLPPEIGSLRMLKWMHLAGTRLTSVPPEIGSLKSLKRLDLSFIKPQLISLPPEIGSLTSLTDLSLLFHKLQGREAKWSNVESLATRRELDEFRDFYNKAAVMRNYMMLKYDPTSLFGVLPLEVIDIICVLHWDTKMCNGDVT